MIPQMKFFFFIILVLLCFMNISKIEVFLDNVNNYVNGVDEISINSTKSDIDKLTNNFTETRTTIKTNIRKDIFSKPPIITKEVISETKIEYHIKTTQELINNINIDTKDDSNINDIRSILAYKPEDNVLENITSINIKSKYEVSSICEDDNVVGCFNPNDRTIYLTEKSGYGGLCNTFGSTLLHEIGHAKYYSLYGNRSDLNIEYKNRPDEIYANEYQKQRSVDKCDSSTYKNLISDMQIVEERYNSSKILLSKYDRYKCVEPEPEPASVSDNCYTSDDGSKYCVVVPPRRRVVIVTANSDCGVIPRELYYEYSQIYEQHVKDTTEYNTLVDKYNNYIGKSY